MVAVLLWPLFMLMPFYAMCAFWLLLLCCAYYVCEVVLKLEVDKDPKWIVVDEALAVWLVPIWFLGEWDVRWIGAWLLFRVIDILKPWPVNMIEKIPVPAVAVIFDDIFAMWMSLLLISLL